MTVRNNDDVDGNRSIALNAQADGYAPGSDDITLSDDDVRLNLQIQRIKIDQVEILWEIGTLQSADLLSGPWIEQPTASSPHTVELGLGQRYFRLAP